MLGPLPYRSMTRKLSTHETFTYLVPIARRSVLQKRFQVEHEVPLSLGGSTRFQQPGGGPDQTTLRKAPLDPRDHQLLAMVRVVLRAHTVGHLPSLYTSLYASLYAAATQQQLNHM